MDPVIQLLYTISTALQVPVMVILLLFLGWTALQTGILVRENFALHGYRKAMRKAVTNLNDSGASNNQVEATLTELDGVRGPAQRLIHAAKEHTGVALVLGKILDDTHIRMNERTNRVGVGIRLGPMFGLMGTLIPMGPALTGLASGDINVLSQNLVVAFSTTVLGLLVGGTCYVLQFARKRRYTQDLSDLDFLHDVLLSRVETHNA